MNSRRQIRLNSSVTRQAGPRSMMLVCPSASHQSLQYNQHPARAVSGKCLKLISGASPTRLDFANSAQTSAMHPSQNNHFGELRTGNHRTAVRTRKEKVPNSEGVKQQSRELKYGRQGALSLTFKSYWRPRSWIALR